MPQLIPLPIDPPPGVVKNNSPRASEGLWTDAEKMRFVGGKAQKLGGWEKLTETAADGAIRTLHAWRDLDGQEHLGAGTYKKLYIYDREFVGHNITPATTGTLGNNPFTTTNGSTTVTVTHTNHGRTVGSTVVYDGASAVGGITIDGEYVVTAIVDANTYTITHSAPASSGATGGGASVTYEYEIIIGADAGAYGLGYGVGGYGEGTYGDERDTSTIFIEPRIWSIDHFGAHGLFAYNVGRAYFWDPGDTPLYQRATLISDSPTDIRYLFVTPERFAIALCSNMAIKWCSQGDYTDWTPDASNTAGSRNVTEGTKLVGARSLAQATSLIWSDAAVYLHQYTGSSFVFDTRVAGKNCGLISPSAAVVVGGTAYWMGHNAFFRFSSFVEPLPRMEDIKRYVFDALDSQNGYLCAAMYVPKFNEVWFFYVEAGTLNPGLFVIYSIDDPCFSIGELTRVAGTHFQHGDVRPILADGEGDLYRHEEGYDADGVAMEAHITMAPAGLDKGGRSMELEGFEPDFHEQDGEVTVTFNAWDRIRTSADAPDDTDELTAAETDGLIDPRLEGRYMGLTINSNTLGGYFRMGKMTAYVRASGSRR